MGKLELKGSSTSYVNWAQQTGQPGKQKHREPVKGCNIIGTVYGFYFKYKYYCGVQLKEFLKQAIPYSVITEFTFHTFKLSFSLSY